MILDSLKTLFNRDLNRLKTEIESYQNENAIWIVDKNISNSAGNLCLHLLGNINTYIGAQLGNTGYIRDRPFEFSLKDIPKTELIDQIENTITMVNTVLDSLTDDNLETIYPEIVFEEKMTTGFFLMHLSTHLAYHLGQINYHRRFLD